MQRLDLDVIQVTVIKHTALHVRKDLQIGLVKHSHDFLREHRKIVLEKFVSLNSLRQLTGKSN